MSAARRALCACALAVGLGVGAVVAWNNGLRDRLLPKRWGEVEKGLVYRSGRIHPSLLETTFKKYGIDRIINLCGQDMNSTPEDKVAAKLGIGVSYIPMHPDGSAPPEDYASAIKEIVRNTREGKQVLIHCGAGVQRTGGVVAAYRLLIQQAEPHEVYDELVRYDWKPDKDQELLDFLNANMGEVARLLEAEGILAKPPGSIPRLCARGAP